VIGLEHTRIVPSESKKKEEAQDKVVKRAQMIFEQQHPGVALFVSIHWLPHPSIADILNNNYDRSLSELVGEHLPQDENTVELHWENMSSKLSNVFHAIHIHRLRRPETLWYSPRSGFVMPLLIDQIQERLTDKETKINGYRKFFTEVWLLIAHDGGGPSSFHEPEEAALQHVYTSSFNRVFLMPMSPRCAVDLKLQVPSLVSVNESDPLTR